jgi:hypothetical protein
MKAMRSTVYSISLSECGICLTSGLCPASPVQKGEAFELCPASFWIVLLPPTIHQSFHHLSISLNISGTVPRFGWHYIDCLMLCCPRVVIIWASET